MKKFLLLAAFLPALALAQQYPSKPIRVIVAIAPGSPTDVMMRSVAQELVAPLGQQLTIENRPGGDMVIGSELCARSAPDGYNYCVVSNTAVSPDIPTYNEEGLDGFPRTWWGLFAPAATPDAAVRRVNAEFVRLFNEPKFSAYLEGQFLESAVSSPEKFAVMLRDERENAGQMIRKYNIPRQ